MCGRIIAYQYGGPDAFTSFDINENLLLGQPFVDGIVLSSNSFTQHIWTFVVGTSEDDELQNDQQLCNCYLPTDRQNTIPSVVGNDYFCESQNGVFNGSNRFRLYAEDVLWDREDCLVNSNCCEFNRPPYFIKDLGQTVTGGITAQICLRNGISNADIAVEVVELYVHEYHA